MTYPLVTVWKHREINGWYGDPADLPSLNACPVVPLDEALRDEYETDAHVWPGWVETADGPELQSPRINIEALPTLAKMGARLRFQAVFVDVDDPVAHATKTPARAVWRAAFAERVAALPEWLGEGVGWYESKGGARLVWTLDEAVEVADYARILVGLRAVLRAHGFDRVDEFTDWGRCYRLPRVMRDGKAERRLVKIAALGDLPLPCATLRKAAPAVTASSSPFERIAHAQQSFTLPKIVEEGGRNQTAVRLAGSLRRSGLDEDDILIALRSAVQAGRFGDWVPDRDELERIARNIGRKPAGPELPPPAPRAAPMVAPVPSSSDDGDDLELAVKPTIQVKAGDLVRVVGELEAALVPAEVYQRSGQIVTTSRDPSNGYSLRITPLANHGLRLAAACVADWQSWKSAKPPKPGEVLTPEVDLGEWIPTDPPMHVIQALEAKGSWALRPLVGVTEVPVLRPDGSLRARAGYDEGTGYLFDPGALDYPQIPEAPTWAQARAALDELIEPIEEFDFQTASDRSVAVAGFIAAVIRPALDKVPMTILDGHTPGSGKTTQAQIAAILATGREVPVVSETGEEEIEKRITALLTMGEPVTLIDNVTRPIGGGALDALLTGREWRGRRLGMTEMVTIPNRTNLFFSGNNVTVRGDLYRRALRSYLDAQDESPEHRTNFRIKDLLAWVTEHRARLVVAALTVVRGYVCSEERGRVCSGPLQSFGAWSRLVREPLIWLGEDDPVKTQEALRRIADQGLVGFEELLGAWLGYFGEKSVTVSEALEELPQKRGNSAAVRLIHAIEEITTLPIGDRKTSSKIGYEIRSRKNRVVSGLFFTQGDQTKLGRRWKIEKKSESINYTGDDGIIVTHRHRHRHPSNPA